MKINYKDYQIRQGKTVKLKKWPTCVKPFYNSKDNYTNVLENYVIELGKLQRIQYAAHRYALLLIFQGIDASGKDGAIRHVMSGVDPQGCDVSAFKHPSVEELEHDFLWRAVRRLPERGRIGIFNRSYYEDVLIVRVHPQLLHQQGLPEELINEKKIWQQRYQSILNFENHLHMNGTRIIKFYLHISKEEQRQRLLERIDDPSKNWKISEADIKERNFWHDYQNVYEECLSATSTKESPWYIVPADDKLNARLIISEIILDSFEKLKLDYPKASKQHRKELLHARKLLTKK